MIVIQRLPGGMAEYLTLDPEYSIGNPQGAWSADPKIALGFARKSDAENFMKKFRAWFDFKCSIGEVSG